MDDALRQHIVVRERALERVRAMLVDYLKVPLRPEQIDLDAPLFGTGIGLDSIDAVELVVAIENELGITLSEDDAQPWAFRTVHSLVELVVELAPGASE